MYIQNKVICRGGKRHFPFWPRLVCLFVYKMCNEDKTVTGGRAQWAHYCSDTHPYLPDGHRYREINADATRLALLAGLAALKSACRRAGTKA